MKKISWLFIIVLSAIIGLYPIIYFLIDRRFGLLSTKSTELLSNSFWNFSFYGHIIFGGLALLIGWLQFNDKIRLKWSSFHRIIGRIYFISVLISGFCGLYIALYATGGIICVLGFLSLGIVWLISTFLGFNAIIKGNIALHRKFMIISYAVCFSAVTLRIWLPLLTIVLNDFTSAYRIVAWLCWVPNILVSYKIINENENRY